MHILIANNLPIPALKYGGTERVIWWLGKELSRRGHRISYLVPPGSSCPFGDILPYDPSRPLSVQIPERVDIVHSNFPVREELAIPFVVTIHGYTPGGAIYDRNTIFVSRRHAELHHSSTFVHNGLDPEEYGEFSVNAPRTHLLFLAAIDRVEKNLPGAIKIAKRAKKNLAVIGGKKYTLSRRIRYFGMIGGDEKNEVLRHSSALLFPVTWDEPFGLALIEAMYHGSAVIGTTYGALPEIVTSDVGILSDSLHDLIAAAHDHSRISRTRCHDYVMTNFTSARMTTKYLELYATVLDGGQLNPIDPYFTKESFNDHYPIRQ